MEGRESVEWALACAFHGCCVERMYVNSRCGWLPKMPHNVAVKRLHLFLGGGERAEDITEFLSRIHKIEEATLESCGEAWNTNVHRRVAAYCRERGIGRVETYKDFDLPSRIPRFLSSDKK